MKGELNLVGYRICINDFLKPFNNKKAREERKITKSVGGGRFGDGKGDVGSLKEGKKGLEVGKFEADVRNA